MAKIELAISSNATIGTQAVLEFSDTRIYNELGGIVPVSLENGSIEVISSIGIRGDVDGDGQIRANDAILTLRIVAGLASVDESQKWAADMNGDGEVKADDAILILRKAGGLTAPSAESLAGIGRQIRAMLPEAHGVAGENITVPVKVDNIAELAGGNICITYDSTILSAIAVSSKLGQLLVSNIAEPGFVYLAFAGLDRLDSKIVAEIQFEILTDDVSPLEFQTVELYRRDALPLDSKSISGRFRSWAIPPGHSALLQNFPNPFNPETWIPYQLQKGEEVSVRIYSMSGQLVREFALGYKPAGLYISQDRAIYWDGRNEDGEYVSSGVFFYQITAGSFKAAKKMIILR